MDFAPHEVKVLHVGYILPMSFALGTCRKDETPKIAFNPPPPEERPWQARVEACIVVYCAYITETG